ncbi:MAG: Zn-dependent hydrolase [Pseudomonadota bacterium]
MTSSVDPASLCVSGARLWDRLMRHAQIGAREDGGINREALTPEDGAGRRLFADWCTGLGLEVAVDRLGNMFATLPGQNPDALAVGIGSHLDTQPFGGKFDGILGVLAALEAVETIRDAGIVPKRSLTIVNWTAEEGSRFVPSMAASGAYAGIFTEEEILAATDDAGISFGDALDGIGFRGDEPLGQRRFAEFLELHIEQGPVLEAQDVPVGILTGAQAMSFNRVTIGGVEAHAGTTPMEMRRDPVAAMTRILAACFSAAEAEADGRCTVGAIDTVPRSHSSIPRQVDHFLDLRHPEQAGLERLLGVFEKAAEAERAKGFTISRDEFGSSPAMDFDARCTDAIRTATDRCGIPARELISGAGHDALYIARTCPTGMIFCRCKDGISHNPAESITPEDAEDAANVLLHAALDLANN